MRSARNEEDDYIRVELAGCLMLHGSAEARKFARSVADEWPEEPERRRIFELEAIRETVAGRETPAIRALLDDMERGIEEGQEQFKMLQKFGMPSPTAKAKPRVGRNDPCPCGSGKKYKNCCMES